MRAWFVKASEENVNLHLRLLDTLISRINVFCGQQPARKEILSLSQPDVSGFAKALDWVSFRMWVYASLCRIRTWITLERKRAGLQSALSCWERLCNNQNHIAKLQTGATCTLSRNIYLNTLLPLLCFIVSVCCEIITGNSILNVPQCGAGIKFQVSKLRFQCLPLCSYLFKSSETWSLKERSVHLRAIFRVSLKLQKLSLEENHN